MYYACDPENVYERVETMKIEKPDEDKSERINKSIFGEFLVNNSRKNNYRRDKAEEVDLSDSSETLLCYSGGEPQAPAAVRGRKLPCPYGRVVSESPHAEQLGSLGNPAAMRVGSLYVDLSPP
eukprot:9479231-Pyramimonas_sp.AAC.3